MHAIADTEKLVSDGIITGEQAVIVEARARETMVYLAINSLLCFGIIAATAGLIFWLKNAMAVAICGALALAVGLFILARGRELFHMFGNASALIGAGMLIGGASLELLDKYEGIAGWALIAAGLVITGIAAWVLQQGNIKARFVSGSILLMGGAMHLGGVAFLLEQNSISGMPISLFYLYATFAVAGAGWITNVRFVTALAIIPFAQALDTGTFYFHAAYAFYSPESTLSILQMSLLIGLCIWAGGRLEERTTRHLRILTIMAFIVANLCALVGSLWGDFVGETTWGPGYSRYGSGVETWQEWRALRDAFRETAFYISEEIYAILWALILVAMAAWAAFGNRRGLFNTTLTFIGIHAYTQMFESFGDEPLAYVIGGLAAIPLAWGMLQLNHWLVTRADQSQP